MPRLVSGDGLAADIPRAVNREDNGALNFGVFARSGSASVPVEVRCWLAGGMLTLNGPEVSGVHVLRVDRWRERSSQKRLGTMLIVLTLELLDE